MWDRREDESRETEWLRGGIGFRLAQTLMALLFGSGILVFLLGLLTDDYSWKMGIIGLAVLWGAAFVLRVFVVTPER